MQAKHTPGPWAYEQETDNSTDFWVFQSDGPVRVAVECSESDAALITAAPDLLENLRQLADLLESIGHDCTPAREVIARATGEA